MRGIFAPKPTKSVEPEVVKPPESTGMSEESVQKIVAGALTGVTGQLAETLSRMGEKIEALAARQPQVVVQQPTATGLPSPTLEAEVEHAVLTGSGAADKIRQLIDREVQRAVKPLQDYGVTTLNELSRRVTTTGMKHYGRFKKEIDERLNSLSPDVRSSPMVIETIYNAVVGTHSDELAKEAAEAAVRQAQEPTPDPARSKSAAPGGASGQPREANDVPGIEDFLGSKREEGLEALQWKGEGSNRGKLTQDDFARSMGYADWSTYMKQYQELLDAEGKGNA